MPDVAVPVGVITPGEPRPAGLPADDEGIDRLGGVLWTILVSAFPEAAGFDGEPPVVALDGGLDVLIRVRSASC
jgi:hypothetical protein